MNPLALLGHRGQRPASPPVRLGGADDTRGAVSTLEREPGSPLVPPAPTDVHAADRFTVEVDERDEVPAPPSAPEHPGRDRTSSWRLLGRLGLVVGLSLLAFRHTVGGVVQGIAGGSILVYVLAVPLYAGLAAAASSRRPGFEEAGGVRRRDLVAGSLTCLVALGFASLLGPGLSGVHELWHLDLLMLWVFLLGATVLSFGVHQVVRSWPFWAVSLLLWPFPVRLANTALGGAAGGALLLLVVVLGVVAYGHRRHDPPRWQVLGSVAGTGAVVLALSGMTTHPQRLWWPSVAAALVAVLWWAGQAHVRPQASVVEHRVRGTTPRPGRPRRGRRRRAAGRAAARDPEQPDGHHLARPRPGPRAGLRPDLVDRQQGPAALLRPHLRLAAGRAASERSPYRRRPGRSGDRGGRHQHPAPAGAGAVPRGHDLPHGHAVVDAGRGGRPRPRGRGAALPGRGRAPGPSYTLLTFSWRLPVDMALTGGYTGPPAQLTQRITLIAVDDHRVGAPFPTPGNATLDGIRTAVERVGRDQQPRSGTDLLADEQLLDDAARGLVHQRLTGG